MKKKPTSNNKLQKIKGLLHDSSDDEKSFKKLNIQYIKNHLKNPFYDEKGSMKILNNSTSVTTVDAVLDEMYNKCVCPNRNRQF